MTLVPSLSFIPLREDLAGVSCYRHLQYLLAFEIRPQVALLRVHIFTSTEYPGFISKSIYELVLLYLTALRERILRAKSRK